MGGKRGESRQPETKKGVEAHSQTVPVHFREQHAPHISLHARRSSLRVSDSRFGPGRVPVQCNSVVSIQANDPRHSSATSQGPNNSERSRYRTFCSSSSSADHSTSFRCHTNNRPSYYSSNRDAKQTFDGKHHSRSDIQPTAGRYGFGRYVPGCYTFSYTQRLLVLSRHLSEFLYFKRDWIRCISKENGKKSITRDGNTASGDSNFNFDCLFRKLDDVRRAWLGVAPKVMPYAVLAGGVVASMFLLANPVSAAEHVQPPIPDYFHSFLYWLLGWIFRLICGVVYTLPVWIFTSTGFMHTFSAVAILSISLIGLKGVWKGVATGYAKQEVSNKEIGGMVWRLVIVMIGIGFLPTGLDAATHIINRVTLTIGKFGFAQITGKPDVSTLNNAVITKGFTDIDVFGLAIFDALLLWNAVPLLFQAGRRWVDMAILGVVSPLALSCFVFEDTKHYGRTWWNGVKKIGVEQIWQVSLLAFLLLLMFGSKQITGPADVFVKVLLLIGGLSRMKQPPTFMPSGGKSKMGRSVQKRITDTAKKLVIPKKS